MYLSSGAKIQPGKHVPFPFSNWIEAAATKSDLLWIRNETTVAATATAERFNNNAWSDRHRVRIFRAWKKRLPISPTVTTRTKNTHENINDFFYKNIFLCSLKIIIYAVLLIPPGLQPEEWSDLPRQELCHHLLEHVQCKLGEGAGEKKQGTAISATKRYTKKWEEIWSIFWLCRLQHRVKI